ncbi:MAG: hypothetical protein RI922_1479 [Bacteroidota bacterium]|jgi:DNA-binding NarL/FixJ family response regulator
MKKTATINIGIIEKHPVLLGTLKSLLETNPDFSIKYHSQNSLGLKNTHVDVLIINEEELNNLKSPLFKQQIICLSSEFRKKTINDSIVYLNKACDLEELVQSIYMLK